ncbi:uncharacterized protein VTP21DRAFT_5107 [Calcarisporiella thermophila]|uniref:uncharacterized protein n=1 Tax=Calcarisporiella thermophila TaxID=911321 RepID=UPI00374414C9
MKFAKQLCLRGIPDALDYKGLKHAIRVGFDEYHENNNDPAILNKVNKRFRELLEAELSRVEGIYDVRSNAGAEHLEALNLKWRPDWGESEIRVWREEMTALLHMLEDLVEYTKINITGFQKILKKYDKHFQAHPTVVNGVLNGTSALLSITPDGSVMVSNSSLNRSIAWSPVGKELWALVTACKFVKSERDENLLHRARQIWRKRVPLSSPTDHDCSLSLIESDVPTITDLDLDALPMGKISRVWVALASDGLSAHIKIPVIVAKGNKPGPVVGLTAALHGNELNGIPLIHRLLSQDIKCSSLHGIVVAVPVANVPGYLAGIRTFSDGQDLNRLMPGKKNGSTSQVYAYQLMERVISKFEYLLDLHTASKGRVNSLYCRADMTNPRTRRMARLQHPQIIVHNTSPDGSLRGAAMERGIPAITVEIGDPSRFQKRFVRNALLGVTNILSHLKMIPDDHDLPEFDPVICSKSYWIFADGGGVLNVIPDIYTWLKKGDPIATLHSIFGKLEKTYYAPEDGVVVGKSVDPVCQSGSRILHLGVVAHSFPERVDDGHL